MSPNRPFAFTLALLAVAAIALPAAAQPKPANDKKDAAANLPVTKTVLFSSGVGYFEHAGEVDGNATLELMFKRDQINDVLKSMVLMDLGGGKIASVTYGSKEPLERALKGFGVDISDAPTLPQLLHQLRGATVTVEAPDKVTGKILSVEPRVSVVNDTRITEYILTLVTNTGIKSINMNGVQSLNLADGNLQNELNEALTLLVDSRDQDRKPVTIRFTGKGKRKVRIGYLIETPVWKTSYRLDLSGDKPLLQGWSIVENTTDADWKKVNLSLVAGRPISFIQDLYTPLFVPRPVVRPKLYASLVPPDYAEGIEANKKLVALGEAAQHWDGKAQRERSDRDFADAVAAKPGVNAPGRGGAFTGGKFAANKSAGIALDAGVAAMASGGDLGELFEFTIAQPVDLARRRSSMLPIINKGVEAEKVSIYNEATLGDHPLNGVWFGNTTGMKLLAGPVTVFDGGAYAGDARIDNMTVGEKRLLSYAVDLAVKVDPSQSSTNNITSGKIVRGVLYVQRMQTWNKKYVIKNKAKDKKTIIVEHPFVNGRKLVAPNKSEEKTDKLYRFKLAIDGDTTGEFVVKEQQPTTQTIAIINTNPNTILAYIRSNEIDKDVRDALSKAASMKQSIDRLQGQMNQKRAELTRIQQGQQRLRENIKTVGATSTLGKRYLQKLSAEEDLIEKLEKEIAGLQNEINKQNDAFAKHVQSLNVGG